MLSILRNFFIPKQGKLKPLPCLVIVLSGIFFGLAFARTNFISRLEWFVYDRYMKAFVKDSKSPPDIIVVAVDELSFQEVGLKWPWPRVLHASLVETLKEAGARVIVFDIIFDRESGDREEDEYLVSAVRDAGNVVLAMDEQETNDSRYTVKQLISPFPGLEEVAAGEGLATLPMDPDGVIRRTQPYLNGIPSLSRAACLLLGMEKTETKEGDLLIHYNGEPRIGIETVSYYQALNPAEYLPDGIFKDKVVFIGISLSSPPVLGRTTDHYETPVSTKMAGVEIHANILDSILRNRFISDPFNSFVLLAFLILAFTLPVSYLFYRTGAFKGLLLVFAAGLFFFAGGYVFMRFLQVRIPVISVIMVVSGVFLLVYLYRFLLGIVERRLILGAFKHYLAPSIVDSLLEDPSRLSLGGRVYDVTVLFTDLANFTGVSENMSPGELQRLLTEYFDEMMKILSGENATLDKFIGDAIMAFFGCPVEDSMHPVQACRGAAAMQKRLRKLNEKWKTEGLPDIRMRVGINSGEVIAGNMGTENIFNYTILGDNVNLASRLEGVNKVYGTGIIVSRFTFKKVIEECKGYKNVPFVFRELDSIRVKGKKEPVSIYELYDLKENVPGRVIDALHLYEEGLGYYRKRQWKSALSTFDKVFKTIKNDAATAVLAERTSRYVEQPPGSDWDGVHVMKTK